MGNHSNTAKITSKEKAPPQAKAVPKVEEEINLKRFNKINVVGKGGFGKVIDRLIEIGLGH